MDNSSQSAQTSGSCSIAQPCRCPFRLPALSVYRPDATHTLLCNPYWTQNDPSTVLLTADLVEPNKLSYMLDARLSNISCPEPACVPTMSSTENLSPFLPDSSSQCFLACNTNHTRMAMSKPLLTNAPANFIKQDSKYWCSIARFCITCYFNHNCLVPHRRLVIHLLYHCGACYMNMLPYN